MRGNLDYEIESWSSDPKAWIVPQFELAWMRPLVPGLRSLTVKNTMFLEVIQEVLIDGRWWWKVELEIGCGPCLPQELAAEFKGVEVRFESVENDDMDYYFIEAYYV